jgi:hypothetical protein
MIKEFKFLTNKCSEITSTVEFLLEYNRRLDYHYVNHHRIFNRFQQHANAAYDLFNRTSQFIREGQLTTPREVRRYVYLNYRSITGEDYEISIVEAGVIVNDTYNFLTRVRN